MDQNNLQVIVEDLINKKIIPENCKNTNEFIVGHLELFKYIYGLQTKCNRYRFILNNLYKWLEEKSNIQYNKMVWQNSVYTKVLRELNRLKEMEVK